MTEQIQSRLQNASPDQSTEGAMEHAAPTISADFLTGSTEIGLDRIRTRLLDLTNRNRLLNFRYPKASSLRVVGVSIEDVFRQLVDNQKLAFVPVPEPASDEGDRPTAAEYAEQLGWSTSYDLDESTSEAQTISSLPVLLYPEQLDTLGRKISSAAKTAIEESGTSMLYLVFGFLEWYESDDSNLPHLAPLVTLPVTLERSGGKGKAIESIIEHSGEDIEANLSLVEKLRRDFGLEMPDLEDEDTPENYFDRFADILRLKKRWRIRRQIVLGLLSFGKLLMFRDLDPRTWPIAGSIAKHSLVRALFEGTKKTSVPLAEEYPIDDPELKTLIPHLIRDADSSQHSALVHALGGQNLVLEGPPGTGKSQTITNLIAAALAKGKTVLFVSEKLAALEVVRRRLDDAGLGVFCLEVHSHKTKKGALLSDLEQRCKARGTFRDPRDLDRQLAIVEEKKRVLTNYAALINKTIEPFQATVFEILWARDRCGQDILVHRDSLGHLVVPDVASYTRAQFIQAEQFLAVYSEHLTTVLNSCENIDQHKWAWITRPLSFQEEEHTLSLLEEFLAALQEVDASHRLLEDTAGIALPRTLQGLESAAYGITLLPDTDGSLVEDLLKPCQQTSNRKVLTEFVSYVESFRAGVESLSTNARDVSLLLEGPNADQLLGSFESLGRRELDGRSIAEARALLSGTAETAGLVAEAGTSLGMLLNIFGCEAPFDLPTANCLLEAIRLIEIAPFEKLHLRDSAFEEERITPILNVAQEEGQALKDRESVLRKSFNLSLAAEMYTPAKLLQCATVLEESSLWHRMFGGDYQRAVKAFSRISLSRKKARREQMAHALRTVAEHSLKRIQFESNAEYREIMGASFRGLASAWDDLRIVHRWYQEVFRRLPEHQTHTEPFRQLLFTAKIERLRAIRTGIETIAEHRSSLEEVVRRIAEVTRAVPSQRALISSGSFDEIVIGLNKLIKDLHDLFHAIDRVNLREEVLLGHIPVILKTAHQCRNARAAVDTTSELPALLGATFHGVSTNIEPVKNTVRFAESIASGPLPQKTIEWLLCRDFQHNLHQLRTWLTNVTVIAGRLRTLANDLGSVSGSVVWRDVANHSCANLQVLAERALSNRFC